MSQYNRSEVLSVSSVKAFQRCPQSFYLRYVANVKPLYESPEARRGTEIHEMLAMDVMGSDREMSADPETVALVEKCRELYGKSFEFLVPEAEYLSAVYPELVFFIDGGGSVSQIKEHAAFAGTIDLLFYPPGAASITIRDYKTGRTIDPPWGTPIETDMQLRVYGYAATRLFPDAQSVVLQLDYIRYGRREVELPREYFDIVWNEICSWTAPIFESLKSLENGSDPVAAFPCRPSELCSWCDARAHCPLWRSTSVTVAGDQLAAATGSGNGLQTREDALRLAEVVRLTSAKLKEADDALRAYVEQNGALTNDAGEVLDFHPTTRPVIDVPRVIEALKSGGVDSGEILGAMSLTKGAALSLVKGRSKEATATRKAILEAITNEPGTKFGWQKVKR